MKNYALRDNFKLFFSGAGVFCSLSPFDSGFPIQEVKIPIKNGGKGVLLGGMVHLPSLYTYDITGYLLIKIHTNSVSLR